MGVSQSSVHISGTNPIWNSVISIFGIVGVIIKWYMLEKTIAWHWMSIKWNVVVSYFFYLLWFGLVLVSSLVVVGVGVGPVGEDKLALKYNLDAILLLVVEFHQMIYVLICLWCRWCSWLWGSWCSWFYNSHLSAGWCSGFWMIMKKPEYLTKRHSNGCYIYYWMETRQWRRIWEP